MQAASEARILGVGVAAVDVINTVDRYPGEDDEVRASAHRITRGGNATNTLVVLSQLGYRCDWAGVLADGSGSRVIEEDLRRYGVGLAHCVRLDRGKNPTSYVILNRTNGSRTIVHYRDVREFSFEDFSRIDLAPYAWIHFEGRNVDETLSMMRLSRLRPGLRCSLEVEKDRTGIDQLFDLADVVLFSRAFALGRGFATGPAFLRALRPKTVCPLLVCGWADAGAYAIGEAEQPYAAPAFPPAQVIDTLGAGDCFNAGIIDGLICGDSPSSLLRNACRLAGRKCGREGFDLGLLRGDFDGGRGVNV